jgi:alanine dehydrogenase
MNIGVPKETHSHEHRVGLTPFGAARLVHLGHKVYVQNGAGNDSHFRDDDYAQAAAAIVFSADEAYQRADIVCRVSALDSEEAEMVRPGSTVLGFHHLAIAPRELVVGLQEKKVTMVGYEVIEDGAGHRPVLTALREVAGQMVLHTADQRLEHDAGGRGLVLGGTPGMAPATVVILGAGTVGKTAARMAVAGGAHVIILDTDMDKLREVMEACDGHVVTAMATRRTLTRFSAFADVLIGAVLIPGGRAPFLVTEEMVKGMKRGSVIMDVSIDQGGCVETSRPTPPESPYFQLHGVTHYCVANMTANAPRSASRVLMLAGLPYVVRLAGEGMKRALRADPGLGAGVYLYEGHMVNEQAAHALGLEHQPLHDLLR